MARIPADVVAIVAGIVVGRVRGDPAAVVLLLGKPAGLYPRRVGGRATVAAGLLQATSLPFLVTAVQIGPATGRSARPPAPRWDHAP